MINHYHFAGGGCNENVRTMGFPVLIVNIEATVPSVPQNQKETTNLTNKERNRVVPRNPRSNRNGGYHD